MSMHIELQQLSTEAKQKEIVDNFVKNKKRGIYDSILVTPTNISGAVVKQTCPITQYLYAIFAKNLGDYNLPDIPPSFTDSNALLMYLNAGISRAQLLKACSRASLSAVNTLLQNNYQEMLTPYSRPYLIMSQIVKGDTNGRLLFDAVTKLEAYTSPNKKLMLLGILVHCRKDTDLIRKVYKEFLKYTQVQTKDPWKTKVLRYAIDNMIAPLLYKTIKKEFTTTVVRPDPDKLTAADIKDIRCSEIGYKGIDYYLYENWDDLLDITDDPYYVDVLILKDYFYI